MSASGHDLSRLTRTGPPRLPSIHKAPDCNWRQKASEDSLKDSFKEPKFIRKVFKWFWKALSLNASKAFWSLATSPPRTPWPPPSRAPCPVRLALEPSAATTTTFEASERKWNSAQLKKVRALAVPTNLRCNQINSIYKTYYIILFFI